MTDILTDSQLSLHGKSAVFSKIAVGFSIATLLIFLIFIANITALFRIKSNNPAFLGVTTLILLVSMILGVVFSIISIVRKEKLKFIKPFAAVVNIGLFFVVLGTMIFALYMDLKNMHR